MGEYIRIRYIWVEVWRCSVDEMTDLQLNVNEGYILLEII